MQWIKQFSTWILKPIAFYFQSISRGWIFFVTWTGFLLILFLGSPTPLNASPISIGEWLLISGTVTSIWGLNETLTSMGRSGFFEIFRAWIKGFPPFRKKTHSVNLTMKSESGSFGSVSLELKSPPPSDQDPIETKVRWLMNEIDRQKNKLQEIETKVERNQKDLVDRIKKEESERSQHIQSLDQKIVNLNLNGLPLQFFGLFCILIGTVLSFF